MESRNKIVFRLIIILCLIIIFLILTKIYLIKKEIKNLSNEIKVCEEKEKQSITYNLEEIKKEIEFYKNIERNTINLYDEYFTNINKLEIKINNNETNMKIAYLTFDDGPYGLTTNYLDILKEYNVRITFFVLGKNGYDETYRRIVNEGHTLANHTFDHNIKTGLYSSKDSFIG